MNARKGDPTSLQVAKAILERRCPVEPFDMVDVGRVCRKAIEDGLIRVYHGSRFVGWGGYIVTEEGEAALAKGPS